jgi:hypothetical protein
VPRKVARINSSRIQAPCKKVRGNPYGHGDFRDLTTYRKKTNNEPTSVKCVRDADVSTAFGIDSFTCRKIGKYKRKGDAAIQVAHKREGNQEIHRSNASEIGSA